MFSDPQFWVLVAFVIFIVVVFNPIRKILFSSLDNKIKEIKDSIENAEKLKHETQKSLSEIKKKQNDVKKDIDNIHNEANEKISFLEKDLKEKLEEQINKRKNLASIRISQMTREANNEIQQLITKTAILTSIDIIQKKMNEEEKINLINQSIKEFDTALKN